VCGQRGGRRRGRGVDLQILGIGSDGHVGFTEPGSSLASRTRIKTLTRQTRVDNARFFGGDVDAVPTHCHPRDRHDHGCPAPRAAGQRRGQVRGRHHLVEGAESALWPGTALQLHPHVTVILDEEAASRLQLSEYYRDSWASKPSWQGF
jgi:glucosamine-6-phosphate deaminase